MVSYVEGNALDVKGRDVSNVDVVSCDSCGKQDLGRWYSVEGLREDLQQWGQYHYCQKCWDDPQNA